MLIAEQLMLLCIDPQRGDFEVARAHADINSLAAAALLLDLAEQHRLRFKNGHIAVEASLPTTHPQLTRPRRSCPARQTDCRWPLRSSCSSRA